jgi:hypothetical protein
VLPSKVDDELARFIETWAAKNRYDPGRSS